MVKSLKKQLTELEEKTSLREIRRNRKGEKENKQVNAEFASDLTEIKPD